MLYWVAIVPVLFNWVKSFQTLHVSIMREEKPCLHSDGYQVTFICIRVMNLLAQRVRMLATLTCSSSKCEDCWLLWVLLPQRVRMLATLSPSSSKCEATLTPSSSKSEDVGYFDFFFLKVWGLLATLTPSSLVCAPWSLPDVEVDITPLSASVLFLCGLKCRMFPRFSHSMWGRCKRTECQGWHHGASPTILIPLLTAHWVCHILCFWHIVRVNQSFVSHQNYTIYQSMT